MVTIAIGIFYTQNDTCVREEVQLKTVRSDTVLVEVSIDTLEVDSLNVNIEEGE